MAQHSFVKGDAPQRISSAGFIIGAILVAAGGLLMPHANSPATDLQQMLKPLGEYSYQTMLSSLLGMIGFGAVLIGAAGVDRSLAASGAAWARQGFYVPIIGTTLRTVCWALDIATASAAMRNSRRQLDMELAKYPWLRPIALEMFIGKMDPAKLGFLDRLGSRASDNRDWNAIRNWSQSLTAQLRQTLLLQTAA